MSEFLNNLIVTTSMLVNRADKAKPLSSVDVDLLINNAKPQLTFQMSERPDFLGERRVRWQGQGPEPTPTPDFGAEFCWVDKEKGKKRCLPLRSEAGCGAMIQVLSSAAALYGASRALLRRYSAQQQ